MGNDDDRKVPHPLFPRKPALREVGAEPRPPFADDGDEEEDVKDEATWVASGSPYLSRDRTSEVPFFEDEVEKPTNIDWNQPSSPLGADEGLTFDARPPTSPLGEAVPNEYPTEPGFGADGSLSALRDAMRSGSRPRPRAATQGPAPMPVPRQGPMAAPAYNPTPAPSPSASPGPLPIPAPRARTTDPVRAIAPSRRAPQPMPARVRPGPVTTPAPAAPPRRGTNMAAMVGPIVIGGIAVLFLATLALRVMIPDTPEPVEAPMLPVVGGPAPKTMPAPPFDVDAPPAYRPALTAEGASEDLPVRVLEARAADNLELAAAWSDQLVRAENRPERFFGHAALMASVGEVDAAYYWLVRAVQEQGVPPEWLVTHDAFGRLWADSRWDSFVRWVILAKRHHAARGASPATLVLPQSIDDAVAKDEARKAAADPEAAKAAAKTRKRKADELPALPVVVWLDDVGGNGSSVLTWGQSLADDLGVLVVGLGGPERIGPAGSWWTSDPDTDRKHIEAALSAIPGALPDPARRYLIGEGQGAQFAVELVLRDPAFAAGALALAPTDDWKGPRDKAGEGNRDRKQVVDLVAGALTPESHTLLRLDRGRLMRAGAEVTMTIEDRPWPDGTPADLDKRVRAWVTARIDPAAAAAASAAPADEAPVDMAAVGTPDADAQPAN
ncbi:MAG: hypothetical protein H6733_12220 [Alphaproteobacteria bacterium]|nr:hypothetical protein [Alphaproteobacteria bacterium]